MNRTALSLLSATLLLASASLVHAQPVTVTYSYSGLPLPILSDDADQIAVASILVPKALKMTKVTVQVQTQYPNSADLKIYLYSAEGTRSILLEHDCNVANVDTTFDDSAQSLYKDFCPVNAPGMGPFRPDQPLSNSYNDASSIGTWLLAVENDQSDSRSGWLTGFSVTITGIAQVEPTTNASLVRNAASLAYAGVAAPGEMLSIFGFNLGPASGQPAPAGDLRSSLAGVTVTFDGVPAPIAYASNFRVDVQAPFSIAPGSISTIRITRNNMMSAEARVGVSEAAPGIYTLAPNGEGQIAATNQDGSENSFQERAARGSIITFYASGLGAVAPALEAGAIPPASPLSMVTGDVSATIGGRPATVQFAGAAPGFPGIYQMNLYVPTEARSGAQEVIVHINGKSSQRGAIIEVQ